MTWLTEITAALLAPFIADMRFWLAAVIGAMVKAALSEAVSRKRQVASGMAAVYAAWVMTDPTILWLELEREAYVIPVTSFWIFVGEGFMRLIINKAAEPEGLIGLVKSLLNLWRGK